MGKVTRQLDGFVLGPVPQAVVQSRGFVIVEEHDLGRIEAALSDQKPA